MPHLIERLQTVLNPLATGGAHYLVCEADPPPLEYITFSLMGGTPLTALDGPAAQQNYRLEVDVYANRVQRLTEISTAVRTALAGADTAGTLRNVPLTNPMDMFEDAVRLHRRIQEWSVWSTEG